MVMDFLHLLRWPRLGGYRYDPAPAEPMDHPDIARMTRRELDDLPYSALREAAMRRPGAPHSGKKPQE